MWESLISELPSLLWNILFWGIFIKGIVSTDITDWGREKGIIKTKQRGLIWKVLDFFYNSVVGLKSYLRNQLLSTERKQAIFEHEVERLQGNGHQQSLLVCNEGACGSLAEPSVAYR